MYLSSTGLFPKDSQQQGLGQAETRVPELHMGFWCEWQGESDQEWRSGTLIRNTGTPSSGLTCCTTKAVPIVYLRGINAVKIINI